MKMYYAAIDIGGSYIKYAVLDHWGAIQTKHKQLTPENTGNGILLTIQRIIEKLQVSYVLSGIGVSTAGIVDRAQGKIVYAGPTIAHYQGTEIASFLHQTFAVPVHVENDVKAALLGEIWARGLADPANIYLLTLGTGIGGAYYTDQLMDGHYGNGNSIGYMLTNPTDHSNYETRASTNSLKRQLQQYPELPSTIEALFTEAEKGNKEGQELLHRWGTNVAQGIAEIMLILNPSMILLGGGISQQESRLLRYIDPHLDLYLPDKRFRTPLQTARLQNDAALLGSIYPFFQEEII
ncbi:ROK family protein [Marinococcus halophilus]|uniref:N-acetylmannosamine kinase n=1 Tax=Marinococcus halophilus TaxID=1371 RepID=A0A510Y7W8_MARHA|nr:ROK family protein [Marinococcus halophilus]GEK59466.1 N-acetylmannosamine kinase [Marinococcus halophilus]